MITNSHTIRTIDGRALRITDAGPVDAIPVVVHHGTPGTGRLDDHSIEEAQSRGIRLISYDRPGYDGSTSSPGRAIAHTSGDVATIAHELGLQRMAVLGFSAGGPHALACATLLPELVLAAAIVASPAPYTAAHLDWFAGMGNENSTEFGMALKGRNVLKQFVETFAADVPDEDPASVFQAMRSLLGPVDAQLLTEDAAVDMLNGIREAIAEGKDGWIDDDIALVSPWGFELSQIGIPVLLMQGEQDRFIPLSHGKWLATAIKTVDARFSTDDGHFTLLARCTPEVLTWLQSRISQ